jgi:hypothetical protein
MLEGAPNTPGRPQFIPDSFRITIGKSSSRPERQGMPGPDVYSPGERFFDLMSMPHYP